MKFSSLRLKSPVNINGTSYRELYGNDWHFVERIGGIVVSRDLTTPFFIPWGSIDPSPVMLDVAPSAPPAALPVASPSVAPKKAPKGRQ